MSNGAVQAIRGGAADVRESAGTGNFFIDLLKKVNKVKLRRREEDAAREAEDRELQAVLKKLAVQKQTSLDEIEATAKAKRETGRIEAGRERIAGEEEFEREAGLEREKITSREKIAAMPKTFKITGEDLKKAEKALRPTFGERTLGLLQNLIPGTQATEAGILEKEKQMKRVRGGFLEQFIKPEEEDESKQKATEWLKANNAPVTDANIAATIKKFGF